MKKLTVEQQKVIRLLAKEKLIELEELLDGNRELINEFKEKFNICETTYKVILKEHQSSKKRKNDKELKILMTQVPYALEYAGYKFDSDLLSRLFKSGDINKKLTIKEIRNRLTHGIDKRALNELKDRRNEIFKDMNKFISIIRKA